MITIEAAAKINLTLEVLGKCPDGFHEIRSVMQTINLCDRLSFQPANKLAFKSDSSGWVAEKSLISRAAHLMQEHSACPQGAVITVEKRIPLVSGLGGDSSDAAATLKGLNRIWQLGLPHNKLRELAGKLGSDVAFFLDGGTALIAGRGEKVTVLPPLSRWWVVLVIPAIPPLPDKTRSLYERVNVKHYTEGQITGTLKERLREQKEFSPALMFNVFEKVASSVFPKLNTYRDFMMEAGAPHVHLAGSGPTLFSLFENETEANEFCRKLKNRNIETILTETSAPDIIM